jgi:SIR2-like domain
VTFPRRKLLVVLGSGSSIPCCLPSVEEINDNMKKWAQVYPHGATVFNSLWSVLEEYYARREQRSYDVTADFEKVLGEMMALASWVTPSPLGDALKMAVRDGGISDRFAWSMEPGKPFSHQIDVFEELSWLFERLAEFMRERSRTFSRNRDEFKTYCNIFSTLYDEFEVGIYNLNYDNVAITAWPHAFTGFLGGEFAPQAVACRGEWGLIYHLHGSVHHSLTQSTTRIEWRRDLSDGDFRDANPLLPQMTQRFAPIIPTTLIAGSLKLNQLLTDPFQTFYASLIPHVHEADAILIVGYGFGDIHVNRALKNRCSSGRQRPPIVVIDKQAEPTAASWGRWALSLQDALATNFGIEGVSYRPGVELDLPKRSKIWRGGLIEAAESLNDMVDWLRS